MSKVILVDDLVKITKEVKSGPFTLIECVYEIGSKTYRGTGIAKQGNEDKFKEEIGRNIAISRAKKAIWNRMHGKRNNIAFAG